MGWDGVVGSGVFWVESRGGERSNIIEREYHPLFNGVLRLGGDMQGHQR